MNVMLQVPIIVGWYTPTYSTWADRLAINLNTLGLPHDFVPVEAPAGGWEKRTMLKAGEVLKAMDRHPLRPLVLLDVDCLVKDRARVLELSSTRADVSFFMRTRMRKLGGVRFSARSGTMVFRPTPQARRFVETWRSFSEKAPQYAVDQDSLIVAMGQTPGCTFEALDVRYCATAGDKLPDPWIYHDSASYGTDKASNTKRRLVRMFLGAA